VDRIKRISMEILENHNKEFGVDFAENKKTLDKISIIRSKELKNELAGYITKYIKHKIQDQKTKQEQIEKIAQQNQTENDEKTTIDLQQESIKSE
jgi:small subunit ribosomal protein S17e